MQAWPNKGCVYCALCCSGEIVLRKDMPPPRLPAPPDDEPTYDEIRALDASTSKVQQQQGQAKARPAESGWIGHPLMR